MLGDAHRRERRAAGPGWRFRPARSHTRRCATRLRELFGGAARIGAYDAKRVLKLLTQGGVTGAHFTDDPMIGAHLLDPARGFADVEDAAAAALTCRGFPRMLRLMPMPCCS